MATPKNWTPDSGNEQNPVVKAWRNTETGTNLFITRTDKVIRRESGYRYTVEVLPTRKSSRRSELETLKPFNNKKKAREWAVEWMRNHPQA